MASSGNNITAVHFSLIFFVMLSIILGVVAYLNVDKLAELRAKNVKAEKDNQELTRARDNNAEEVTAMANTAGVDPSMEQGAVNAKGPNSPSRRMKANLLKEYGMDNSTLRDLLAKQKRDIEQKQKDLDDAKKRFEEAKTDFNRQMTIYKNSVDKANTEVAAAQKRMRDAQAEQRKAEKALGDATTRHVAALNALRSEKTRMEEAYKRQLEDKNKQIAQLNDTIELKQDIIAKWVDMNFERPDGFIRVVDYSTRLVWINLGTADNLPERMTFSVYPKNHQGVARDSERFDKLGNLLDTDLKSKISDTRKRQEKIAKLIERAKSTTHYRGEKGGVAGDLKGAIEVTRIVGPHLAEARILTDDPYDPIRSGDPLYTPLWSPGSIEHFAFAVHLDGKEFSGLDWPLLRRTVKAAGAKIDAYMNPTDGKIVYNDGGITADTKFLVVTSLPAADQTADTTEKARRTMMSQSMVQLRKDAKRYGVRLVKLADFLQYIGYKQDRRLWRPGDDAPRKLKAGAQSTTTDEVFGRRQSSGRTSGLFKKGGGRKGSVESRRSSGAFNRYGGER